MTLSTPSLTNLTNAIASASSKAFRALFSSHPEHYYYCSLITTGEAHPPVITAWSHEALRREALKMADPQASAECLKWSYSESPYFLYGDEYFSTVRTLFAARPAMTPALSAAEWSAEFSLRLQAMENAIAQLDRTGIFGIGTQRHQLLLQVEVMPPDEGNTARAFRLNPPEALSPWLEEAAEPYSPFLPENRTLPPLPQRGQS